jgi:hypothetical protein
VNRITEHRRSADVSAEAAVAEPRGCGSVSADVLVGDSRYRRARVSAEAAVAEPRGCGSVSADVLIGDPRGRRARVSAETFARFVAVVVGLAGCGRLGFDSSSRPVDAASDGAFDGPMDAPIDLDGAFAGCTRDTFDALASTWTVSPPPVTANGMLRIGLDGPVNDSREITTETNEHSYVGWSTIVQVVQPCAQDNAFAGMGWHPMSGDSVHISIAQGQVQMDLGTLGGPTDPFDPVDDRWLRLRESGGQLFGASSPDGVTWNEFGSVAIDASTAFIDIGVDTPFVTVNPDVAVFDDYIECPP